MSSSNALVRAGHGERDFELCMAVNHHAFHGLLEQCRAVGGSGDDPATRVHLTIASTGAVFGPLATVTDTSKENPETTYSSLRPPFSHSVILLTQV
jgi:nucleoside-diphosphate-sugar epimerase